MEKAILAIYNKLYSLYGPQGWWPIIKHKGSNPTKTGSVKGYHPADYSIPRTRNQIYEIIAGAILTQNTAWPSVEKALLNLNKLKALSPEKILDLDDKKLKQAIKPAGYFNQKAKYLRNITEFFISLKGKTPTREQVLAIKGVGQETADSIMLYAYNQPEFVIDAYTRRIFSCLGLIKKNSAYQEIKQLFEKNLPKDIIIYQEYHALIVEHAKHCYNKKPYCPDDILKKVI
jgi:endonuclease-3 related protein